MERELRARFVPAGNSALVEFSILGAGFILGWFLANSRRPAVHELPNVKPSPLGGEWKNGALWSNLTSFNISAALKAPDLDNAARLEEIDAIKTEVDDASSQAYADTVDRATATNNHDLGAKAPIINSTANAFDAYFARKAVNLVAADIARLKALADDLNAEAKKIPNATDAMGQVNSFLGVFNKLIGLVK